MKEMKIDCREEFARTAKKRIKRMKTEELNIGDKQIWIYALSDTGGYDGHHGQSHGGT